MPKSASSHNLLDEAGALKPPLGRIEKLSIIRLCDLVDVTAICS